MLFILILFFLICILPFIFLFILISFYHFSFFIFISPFLFSFKVFYSFLFYVFLLCCCFAMSPHVLQSLCLFNHMVCCSSSQPYQHVFCFFLFSAFFVLFLFYLLIYLCLFYFFILLFSNIFCLFFVFFCFFILFFIYFSFNYTSPYATHDSIVARFLFLRRPPPAHPETSQLDSSVVTCAHAALCDPRWRPADDDAVAAAAVLSFLRASLIIQPTCWL